MVRSVRLYNDCSSSDVRVDLKGRVLADDDKSDKYREYLVTAARTTRTASALSLICVSVGLNLKTSLVEKYYRYVT